MAYVLYSKYSNYLNYLNYSSYSKLAAGKFRHFFHGQLFFRWPMSGPQPDATKDVFLLTSLDGFYPILIVLNCESLHFSPYITGADIMLKYIPAVRQFSRVRESCSFRFQDAHLHTWMPRFRLSGTRRVHQTLVTADAITASANSHITFLPLLALLPLFMLRLLC